MMRWIAVWLAALGSCIHNAAAAEGSATSAAAAGALVRKERRLDTHESTEARSSLIQAQAKGERRSAKMQVMKSTPLAKRARGRKPDNRARNRGRAGNRAGNPRRRQQRFGVASRYFSPLGNSGMQLQARFGKKMAEIDGQVAPSLNQCTWPAPKKFDLVIAWYTGIAQSDIKDNLPPSFLQQSSTSGFENQAEIKYALRSFEKYGLLDHVGTIHILMDQSVLKNFGAPRFFNYSNKALRIVTDRDLGVTGDNKWSKWRGLDKIPGLSEYFLWLPDDNFMLKPFNMEHLYDSVAGKPFLHSYGSFSLGTCDGMPAVGSGHGPVFMSKCTFSAVADNYWRKRYESTVPIDISCLYTNVMRKYWKWKGQDSKFHKECHTNGGCNPFRQAPLFFNVQGNAISDEYDQKLADRHWGVKLVMPNGPARWFHDNFPTPSRFEV